MPGSRSRQRINMTEAEYQAMWAFQGGRCLLCRKRQVKQRLTRDHDHVTGRVRGLLCLRCNRALGAFEWSDVVIRQLIRYLRGILDDRKRYNERHSEEQ